MGNKKKYKNNYYKKLREESSRSYYDVPALNWGGSVDGEYKIEDRYDFKWKIIAGEKKTLTLLDEDLHEYIKKFKYETEMAGRSVTAFVGTDSQNHLSYSRFVTALCLMVENNGVHVIIHRMDLPKMYDYRYRLLRESDVSAEFLRNHKDFFNEINMPLGVHGDYNSSANLKSNGVVVEATNYIKSFGFNLIIKNQGVHGSFSATYGADYWC